MRDVPGNLGLSSSLADLIESRSSEKFDLYERYISADKVRSCRRIGFDRQFVRATGCELIDSEGQRYLDYDAGGGVFAIGRNHPRVRAILLELLERYPANWVVRDTPLLASLLAEAIAKRMPPGLNRILFTNTGSEAVEAALKFARRATSRPRFLYLQGDFHGLSYGALSVTDTQSRMQLYGKMGEGFGPMLPGCESLPHGDLERLESELAKEDVAAMIFEPIQNPQVQIPDQQFLLQAQSLCRRYGSLFIADEVYTGLGRTGTFLAIEQFGVEPDLVLLAKALSGGMMPVGAVAMRDEIYDRVFAKPGTFVHASTFHENDYSMAAALATLAVLDDEGLIDNSEKMGARLTAGLRNLQGDHEMIGEVRGRGLMLAIDLRAPQKWFMHPTASLLEGRGLLGHFVSMLLMTQHRILTNTPARNNLLRLSPPLIVDAQRVDAFIDSLDNALRTCTKFPDGVGRTIVARLLRQF